MLPNFKKPVFILAVLIILLTVLFVFNNFQNKNCFIETRQEIVRGDSLAPLIKNGEEIKIFYGYYKCNEVKRNDIVAYDYKGNSDPIIKIIKAIPGDKFCLLPKDKFIRKKSGSASEQFRESPVPPSKKKWRIVVNNKPLTNSEGVFYETNESGYKILSLYEANFNGIVPENTYLILGNQPGGTLDSTRFGFIDKNDVIGKVDKIPHFNSIKAFILR